MSEIVQTEDILRLMDTIDDAEEQWGTEFDDANTLNDWSEYVSIYTSRATTIANKNDREVQYDSFIKAAGLALTAAARIRQIAVSPRHYDDWPPKSI